MWIDVILLFPNPLKYYLTGQIQFVHNVLFPYLPHCHHARFGQINAKSHLDVINRIYEEQNTKVLQFLLQPTDIFEHELTI